MTTGGGDSTRSCQAARPDISDLESKEKRRLLMNGSAWERVLVAFKVSHTAPFPISFIIVYVEVD